MRQMIKEQYKGLPLEGPIALEAKLYGEGRADADNIIGALLDAGKGLLWVDDRVSVITSLHVSWSKAKKVDSKWIIAIIELKENDEE